MIYTVSWFENNTPQRVFFNSLSHAKYFAKRLTRASSCAQVLLEESELQAA